MKQKISILWKEKTENQTFTWTLCEIRAETLILFIQWAAAVSPDWCSSCRNKRQQVTFRHLRLVYRLNQLSFNNLSSVAPPRGTTPSALACTAYASDRSQVVSGLRTHRRPKLIHGSCPWSDRMEGPPRSSHKLLMLQVWTGLLTLSLVVMATVLVSTQFKPAEVSARHVYWDLFTCFYLLDGFYLCRFIKSECKTNSFICNKLEHDGFISH